MQLKYKNWLCCILATTKLWKDPSKEQQKLPHSFRFLKKKVKASESHTFMKKGESKQQHEKERVDFIVKIGSNQQRRSMQRELPLEKSEKA